MSDDGFADTLDFEEDVGSDVHREWHAREAHYRTAGYRDGVIAGKNDSAQAGFDFGFKEGVISGFRWGQARGATAVITVTDYGASNLLIPTASVRDKLTFISHQIDAISTQQAALMFYEDIIMPAAGKARWLPTEELNPPTLPDNDDAGAAQTDTKASKPLSILDLEKTFRNTLKADDISQDSHAHSPSVGPNSSKVEAPVPSSTVCCKGGDGFCCTRHDKSMPAENVSKHGNKNCLCVESVATVQSLNVQESRLQKLQEQVWALLKDESIPPINTGNPG